VTVPSVSLSVHDRYSPELRDRILGKLQASMGRTTYRILTPAQLRALAEIESPEEPVLSLYLRLTPERRVGRVWHTVYSSLVHAELARIADRRRHAIIAEEFVRIEAALEAERPELGRGVAFFVCRKLGLWRQIALSLPLPDAIHITERPYIRPLVRTRDEHDSFAIALLSQEHSRFFISQIGVIEEVLRIEGQRLRGFLTDRVARDRRDVLETEATRLEAHVLAHATELVATQFEARHLLFAASPELLASVTDHLSQEMQQRIGPAFAVDVHVRPSEVLAAAEPAQRAVDDREETLTIQRLIDIGPRGAAWGVQPVLNAVHEKRVMTLAVDDVFAQSGARCRNCGALWAEMPAGNCPICASADLAPVDDVIELAIEETLDEKGALELVQSETVRRQMATRGPIAALLRW
jgi:hypothetical protein